MKSRDVQNLRVMRNALPGAHLHHWARMNWMQASNSLWWYEKA